MKRFSALVVALLLAAFGLGLARGGEEKGTEKKVVKKGGDKEEKGDVKEGTKTYDSPEKVFQAFETAARAGNGKAVCATLTEDAAKLMAGRMAAGALIMKGFMEKAGIKIIPGKGGEKEPPKKGADEKGKGTEEEPEDLPENALALHRVLNKHGLGANGLKGIEVSKLAGEVVQPTKAAPLFRRLDKRIKNRCAFIGEMFRTYKKIAGAKLPPQLGFGEKAELENLKTGEDSATATLVLTGTGSKVSQQISFAKEQGGWKLDGPPIFGLPMGGPMTPPGPPAGAGGAPAPPQPQGFLKK